MIRHCLSTFVTLSLALVMIGGQSPTAPPREQPSPAALIAAQREAMVRLAYMDGVWRGPAWTILPSGEKQHDHADGTDRPVPRWVGEGHRGPGI